MLQTILCALFTGLVGLWIGHRLRLGGEADARRRRYRSFLELLRPKVAARVANEFFYDFRRSFAEFDREALEVRPHIRGQAAFDAACAAYKAVEFSPLDNTKNTQAKEKLLARIDELLRLAK